MNMSPAQVGDMSMWHFFAMVEGMSAQKDGLTGQEEDELWDWMQSKAVN